MPPHVIRCPMPCDPWGANQAPSSVAGRIKHHKRKVAVRDVVTMCARSYCSKYRHRHHRDIRPLPRSSVHVTIPFSTNRRRDPHNYTSTVVKAVVDGLRAAGVFVDDTAEHVVVIDPTLVVGGDLIITITPLPDRTTT
jgi:Holliday junction resolvase RusA-like endonuclease